MYKLNLTNTFLTPNKFILSKTTNFISLSINLSVGEQKRCYCVVVIFFQNCFYGIEVLGCLATVVRSLQYSE